MFTQIFLSYIAIFLTLFLVSWACLNNGETLPRLYAITGCFLWGLPVITIAYILHLIWN